MFAGAEAQKKRRYEAACEAQRMDFKPFVMDTFGGIHGAGRDLWGAMAGRCVAGCTPHTRGAELGKARQCLSVRLMESVARQLCALAHVTVTGDEDDGGLPRARDEADWPEDEEDEVEAP